MAGPIAFCTSDSHSLFNKLSFETHLGHHLLQKATFTPQSLLISLLQEIPTAPSGFFNQVRWAAEAKGPLLFSMWVELRSLSTFGDNLTLLCVSHNAGYTAGAQELHIWLADFYRHRQDTRPGGKRLKWDTWWLGFLELTFSSTAELSPCPTEKREAQPQLGELWGREAPGLLRYYLCFCKDQLPEG